MQSLNIVFWNRRNIVGKKDEITLLFKETDILVCIESWLRSKMNFNLLEFN